MAEAVLKHQITLRPDLAEQFDIRVDSAGTGAYHEGEEADDRTIAVCKKHGIPVTSIARAVVRDDFSKFDYILAMDQSNLQTLLRRQKSASSPTSKSRISLFGSFAPSISAAQQGKSCTKAQAIEDPYYGGRDGFETSFQRCTMFAEGFLDYLERERR
ncbi:phosphotyrosine protein phosphatase [Kwoniella heveanensis BCC8398]|uniref:Phosphotyrosine protein phosphatase n=1 Tax=Kwoniella heveanensis BCC8398 TaxID=1296120 RepID=A0A1B9GZK2_9TREE|nr:phosphotyrosine protein phosphatase [Kwoniella heveanensis BCC8398]